MPRVLAVATFIALLGIGCTAQAQQTLDHAEAAYLGCVVFDPGTSQSIADLASQGMLNTQVIELIVVRAEDACVNQRTTWLSFYPPDQRGHMNNLFHAFFIHTFCNGAC
jgi:hypothetical protein